MPLLLRLLVLVALAAGVVELGVAAVDSSAEVVQLEHVDELELVTDAPEPPRFVTLLDTTADSRLPDSPARLPLFRPPRAAT